MFVVVTQQGLNDLHHIMLCGAMRVNGRRFLRCVFFAVTALFLSGCASLLPPPTASPAAPTLAVTLTDVLPPATAALPPTPTTSPYPWTDENAIMSGMCFESVNDAAGRTFVLRSPEDLLHFYDLADHSELCRHPVARSRFDFSDGRILAGLWSRGQGCTARHDVEGVTRDDTARTLFIFLKLVVEGNCDYELVRPFWIGLSSVSGYDVQFVVE
jgi:hypothetical protein